MAYVRDTGRITGGGVDSASGSFAALPAAGNAILVLYSVWRSGGPTISAGGITDNQGNTYTKADEAVIGNVCCGCFYAKNIGSPSGTFTVTVNPDLGTAYIEAVAIEVSNLDLTAPLDQHTPATGTSTTPTVTSGTTTQADEFAVGALVVDDGSDAGIDTSAGWTTAHIHQSSSDTISAYQAYQVLSATGTQTFDGGTLSASVNWAIVVATFKGATGGGSTASVSSVGSGTATFNSQSTNTGAISAQGSGATTLSGAALARGEINLAGTGTATFTGAAAIPGALSIAGQGTAQFTGASASASAITATGAGTLTAQGAATASGNINSQGVATTSFESPSNAVSGALSITGSATMTMTGASMASASINAAGVGEGIFVGQASARSAMNSAGRSIVTFVSEADEMSQITTWGRKKRIDDPEELLAFLKTIGPEVFRMLHSEP